jgi:hypothetical protein
MTDTSFSSEDDHGLVSFQLSKNNQRFPRFVVYTPLSLRIAVGGGLMRHGSPTLNAACPFRKLCPDVVVVQPGQDWDGDNGTGPLDCPT